MEEEKLVMFSSPLGFVPVTCQSQWETARLPLKQEPSNPIQPWASRSLEFTPDDRTISEAVRNITKYLNMPFCRNRSLNSKLLNNTESI